MNVRLVTAVILSVAALPKGPANAADCTTVTLNRSCAVHIDREHPISPLPIRVTSKATVTLQVSQRPLEKIVYDVTVADTVPVDALNALFSSVITPFKSFVSGVGTKTSSVKDVAAFAESKSSLSAASPAKLSARAELLDAMLRGIDKDQGDAATKLESLEGAVKQIAENLREFQNKAAPAWQPQDLQDFRIRFACRVRGNLPSKPGGARCPSDKPLPSFVVPSFDVLDARVKVALEQFGLLPESDRQTLNEEMDAVALAGTRLRTRFTLVSAAMTTLGDATNIVDRIDPAKVSTHDNHPLSMDTPRVSSAATVKISAQDLITKTVTPLATVVVNWGGTHWEASAGALFSSLPRRSFVNAPVIVNGAPSLDGAGKVYTRLTETNTRPTIVPAVLAHYRLVEGVPSALSQRIALLWTFAVGVNPESASADFGTGPTISYRGLMVTPLWHWGRDIRLTNGLTVGEELGSSPPAPTTERFWTRHFGVGVSYRVPIN